MATIKTPQGQVESTQVCMDLSGMAAGPSGSLGYDACDMEVTPGITHYESSCVACNAEDENEVRQSLEDRGYTVSDAAPCHAVSGPDGDVIWR